MGGGGVLMGPHNLLVLSVKAASFPSQSERRAPLETNYNFKIKTKFTI